LTSHCSGVVQRTPGIAGRSSAESTATTSGAGQVATNRRVGSLG
jgi:hypothetical protein